MFKNAPYHTAECEDTMRRIFIDQNVNNSELVISMKIMQGNFNPDTQKDFINQMIHARFLCPAVIDPMPDLEKDGSVIMEAGARVMLSHVTNPNKDMFLVAFTDNKEANKNKPEDVEHTILTTYADFCSLILNENSKYAGFVINPFSENIVLTREIMQGINRNIRVKKQVEIPREN